MVSPLDTALFLGILLLILTINKQSKVIEEKDAQIKVKDNYIKELIKRNSK